MPLLKHRVPKYCRHRATGQAVVSLNGRDVYLGLYGSRAIGVEYDRVIEEWLANNRRDMKQDGGTTVKESRRVLDSRRAALCARREHEPHERTG